MPRCLPMHFYSHKPPARTKKPPKPGPSSPSPNRPISHSYLAFGKWRARRPHHRRAAPKAAPCGTATTKFHPPNSQSAASRHTPWGKKRRVRWMSCSRVWPRPSAGSRCSIKPSSACAPGHRRVRPASTKEASLNDTLSTYGGNVSSGQIQRFTSMVEREKKIL